MAPAIVTATLQSTFLSIISNVLAQVLQAYQNSAPFSIDIKPMIQFAIFTLISTPPNFLWQEFLEDQFPGFTVAPTVVEAKEKPSEIIPEKKLDLRNTVIKFGLDMTLGAIVNTVLFIAGIGALRGADGPTIWENVKTDSWPLLLAGVKLWPLVSILSFTVIPVKQRVVFGSMVGVGWNVFLSLFVAS